MNDDLNPEQPAGAVAGETLEQVGSGSPATTPPVPATSPASARSPASATPQPPATPSPLGAEPARAAPEVSKQKPETSTGRSAVFVGAGILISRIVGLIRQRIFAHYFGSSGEGDAFSAAFRIPNFLQNVFGEGALSASFIPVYAKLLAQDDDEQAGRVANAIFCILALVTSVIVLIGVLTTPYIVTAIAAGFEQERRELTITLVRIFFPGAGLLVLSAWCLGVLNSHHRFFISYTAPVAWNAAIIFALVYFGSSLDLAHLAEATAWGSVAGSALQFGVQLPTVLRLIHSFRPALALASEHVRQVLRSFFPVFISRGVVQISAFVDAFLASFLGEGAVVALNYAQSLYTFALVTSVIVLIGVLTTPYIVTAIAAGFEQERRELTITLVRIFFPGAGLLVLSAWCLGVLNSHHRFFISYTAPVAWNAAIIFALVYFGSSLDLAHLAEATAWGSVAGSALQFGVQLPTVLRLIHSFRPALALASEHVRQVLRSFFPVFISRGVVQISAFVDAFLASFLGEGAVVALNYAQSLYTLPVSLFGMSVSAAELPAMSKSLGTAEVVAETLRHRLDQGLSRITFFIVPSAIAFLTLGDVIAAVLYQTGKFTRDDSVYVWIILAGASIGLLASTQGRLYSSTYYALRDTRTPLLFAVLRVALTTVLGYVFAIHAPRWLGVEQRLGVAGLMISSSLAGWVEYALLRRTLNARIGRTGLAPAYMVKLLVAALAGAAVAWGLKLLIPGWHPIPLAVVVLGGYGTTYFVIGYLFGLTQARTILGRIFRIVGR